jgi:hypothetical protein
VEYAAAAAADCNSKGRAIVLSLPDALLVALALTKVGANPSD